MKEKLICIGGGVGPMAGVNLHRKIIENTETNGTDQDHLEVHHFSRSHDIGDRTEFLLGIIEENPAYGMFRTVKVMIEAAKVVNKLPVIGIPCNTFHSPKIFNLFTELLNRNAVDAHVLNMTLETGKFIQNKFPDSKRIGLMSTTGTRKVGIYNHVLEPLGFNIIEIPGNMQDELHDSIYNKEWGIKAISPVSKKAQDNFVRYAELLSESGADVMILGCTEIPLALPEQKFNDIPLIDPVTALARAFIREVYPDKLSSIKGLYE